MATVIKGSSVNYPTFQKVSGQQIQQDIGIGNMRRVGFSAAPQIPPSNSRVNDGTYAELPEDYSEDFGQTRNDYNAIKLAKSETEDKSGNLLPTREEIEEEYRILKGRYIREGEKILMDAQVRAEEMRQKAFKEIRTQYNDAEEDCAEMRKEALETGLKDGRDRGYKEGLEQGLKDGYDNGFGQCKDSLDSLLRMIAEFPALREEYFNRFQRQLFDIIFQITNKIVKDCLKQKEKKVIQTTLAQLAQGYQGKEKVKITLSAFDVEKYVESDYELLEDLFAGVKHVEFEIDRGAETGTMRIEDDDGIKDASTKTQIDFFYQLADGKFRTN